MVRPCPADGQIRQKSGHGYLTAEGSVGVGIENSTSAPWTLSLSSANGKFVAGMAEVTLEAFDGEWEPMGTHEYLAPTTVRLSAPARLDTPTGY